MALAIIGGSSLSRLADLQVARRQIVRTPYGEPSGALTFGKLVGHDVVFLARHGYGQNIPPHEVNYRANMWALHSLGIKNVLSIAAVGGIRADLVPGALAVPDQILDYTHGRDCTMFERSDGRVRHIDFTWPYCAELRAACLKAANNVKQQVGDGGVYAATQGPRLETAAEINRLERDGADMVGMTGMPETALAKEMGLCYATLAVVSNYAAGRGASAQGIAMNEISGVLEKAMDKVQLIIEQLVTYGD